MSILREIFVKLGLDVDEAAFASGNVAAEILTKGLQKTVDVARELASSILENIQTTAEYGETILRLGAASGLGTKSLQQLGLAAAEEGIGIDDFAHSMILLSRQMAAARDGSDEVKKAFSRAGVSVTDVTGKLRPTEDVLTGIAEHFKTTADGADKTALALHLFGRSGANMIEFLNRGRDDLESYYEAAVPSEEQLAAGKEIVKVQRALELQTRSLWRSAIAPLLPAIRDLLKQYLEWKKQNNEVLKQNLTKFLSGAITVIKALGHAFLFAVGTVKFFKDNWTTIAAIITGTLVGLIATNTLLIAQWAIMGASAVIAAGSAAVAWLAAAAPIALIVAAVTGLLFLFDDLRAYTQSIANGGTGKKTFFGQFLLQMDEWEARAAKTGRKPWWLSVLEAMQIVLESIRKDLIFIDNFFSSPGKTVSDVARGSWRRLKQTVGAEGDGVPQDIGGLTPKEKLWRAEAQARVNAGYGGQSIGFTPLGSTPVSTGPEPTGFNAGWSTPAPTIPATGFGGGGGGQSQVVQNIYPSPGMDEQKLADLVVSKMNELGVVDGSQLESTAAAASYQQ